jgi:hypothetical protein
MDTLVSHFVLDPNFKVIDTCIHNDVVPHCRGVHSLPWAVLVNWKHRSVPLFEAEDGLDFASFPWIGVITDRSPVNVSNDGITYELFVPSRDTVRQISRTRFKIQGRFIRTIGIVTTTIPIKHGRNGEYMWALDRSVSEIRMFEGERGILRSHAIVRFVAGRHIYVV